MILISGISFIGYGIHYFRSNEMKAEFKRFGLEKVGTLTAILELLGGIGLLIGLKLSPVLLFSAAGLSLLMFLGVIVRIKVRDSLWVTMPALFFMVLNASILFLSINSPLEILK